MARGWRGLKGNKVIKRRMPHGIPHKRIFSNFGTAARELLSAVSPVLWIPLNDLGNGEVNLIPSVGSGVATFARASPAWTVLSNGNWGLAANGTPRSYYTPGGIYKGYLPEITSTNLCLRSQDFSVTWANVGTPTLTADTTILGALSLSTLRDDSATAFEGKQQAIPFSGNGQKVVSVFVKKGAATSSVIRIVDSTVPANRLIAVITWAGTVPVVAMTTGTDLTGTPQQHGASGVYRLSFLTTTVTAANANLVAIYPATDAVLAVANTGTIEIGGVQVENQLTPTTYIPTVGTTVQRIGDQLTYNQAIQMPASMYAEVHNIFVNINTNRQHWLDSVLNSGEAGFVLERDDSVTPPPFSVVVKESVGVFPGVVNVGQQLQDISNKVAGYFSLNNINAFIDGVAGVPDTSSPALTNMESIGIGCAPPLEGNQQQPNGCIKNVKIFGTALSSAKLVELTT
jgi:hypothetical protein